MCVQKNLLFQHHLTIVTFACIENQDFFVIDLASGASCSNNSKQL
jgi:hypothetical protein